MNPTASKSPAQIAGGATPASDGGKPPGGGQRKRLAEVELPRLDVSAAGPSRKGVKDQVIERFEQKYIIHPRLVPQIRKYLKPFVIPDPNGKGEIPEYIVTTLQLDTDSMDLALAKERKLGARFKLRIRTYGHGDRAPVFLELKRKVNGVIIISPEEFLAVGEQFDSMTEVGQETFKN